MNPRLKLLITCTVAAGILSGITSCIQVNIKVNRADEVTVTTPKKPGANGKSHTQLVSIIDPSGTSGTITIGTGLFSSGTSGTCFPSPPWDKYFVITTNFLGPFTTPVADSFTNSSNYARVKVQTCDVANGTNLQTGIVIVRTTSTTDRVCATNTPACIESSLLTINSRLMSNSAKYRATIHYKNSTATGLSNIVVKWNYE